MAKITTKATIPMIIFWVGFLPGAAEGVTGSTGVVGEAGGVVGVGSTAGGGVVGVCVGVGVSCGFIKFIPLNLYFYCSTATPVSIYNLSSNRNSTEAVVI